MIKFIKNYFEPNSINFGMDFNICFYIFNFHPFPVFNFFRIDFRIIIIIPNHHMIEFMFCQAIIKRRFVYKMKKFFKLRLKTHFFKQSSASGFNIGFPFTLMTATGIGPE